MAATLGDRISDAGIELGQRIIWSLDRLYARASTIGDHAFFDNRTFPWVPAIEADWKKVRAELDVLLPYAAYLPNFQDISRDQRHLTQDDGWKTYIFYAFGLKSFRNCRRCPETTKLLKRIPGLKTAFFSIFGPGKHLPEHRGPYKGVLRLHLALLIPEPAEECGIRVGTEVRHWEEGKVLIFDDTFQHEAWNHTDRMRVVLFVDLARPMRFPANLVNTLMTWVIALSPFVLGAAGGYLRWERRFEQLINQTRPAPPRPGR